MGYFKQAEEQAKAGAFASYHLGKAGMAALGDQRYVILTGGTSDAKEVVPNGDKYFAYLSEAYMNVLQELHHAQVKDAVLHPFAIGGQFQPDWVLDKEVLIFYA